MKAPQRTVFPQAAIDWMVAGRRQRVLDAGSGNGLFAAQISRSGHQVHCIDSDPERLRHVARTLPTGRHVVAQAEALPYDSCRFDVVTVQESLTRFAPGLALAEFARVLRPGGHLAIVFNTRDDTVPWVKRLARRVQQDDPTAMQGDYGTETIEALESSPYFSEITARNFRNWIPIDRPGLLAMIRRRPTLAALPTAKLESLLHDVGEIYDTSARAPEPLLLPFQATCRRALVDHTELTMPITPDGLSISMSF